MDRPASLKTVVDQQSLDIAVRITPLEVDTKVVKLVLQTTLPVLPAITRQPGFLWFVVRDSCVERLLVCTSASSLQLAPARPVLRQKEIVREVGGVGHGERVGGEELETVPELVPVDTPPLVAVKVQSRLSQSSGPAEAAPLTVSVAPVSAPVAATVAAPEAVNVPVDTSPTVVKFPALAVLLMVSVLPVIPVAELNRPTLAAPASCLTRPLWTTAWLRRRRRWL